MTLTGFLHLERLRHMAWSWDYIRSEKSRGSKNRALSYLLKSCGMYDGSGEFAMRVGIPAKSGVSGGIMAVVPTRMGIGIYSPALDQKGNSVVGIQLLERLSRELYLGIF